MTHEPTVDQQAFDTDEDRFGPQDDELLPARELQAAYHVVMLTGPATAQQVADSSGLSGSVAIYNLIRLQRMGWIKLTDDSDERQNRWEVNHPHADAKRSRRREVGRLLAEAQVAASLHRCVYCGDEVAIVHYSDGTDRYQPTVELGDDFCFDRWDQTDDKPAMFCEESLAREVGQFRHDVQERA